MSGTLAVDGRAVTFGTARRGLGGLWPRQCVTTLENMEISEFFKLENSGNFKFPQGIYQMLLIVI